MRGWICCQNGEGDISWTIKAKAVETSICWKLEEVIEAGKSEDNVELLNELKWQLRGVNDEELNEAEKAVSDTKRKYEALVTERQKELEKTFEKLEVVKGDDLVTKNVAKDKVTFDLKIVLLPRVQNKRTYWEARAK